MGDLKQIGALWVREGKNGRKFLSGEMEAGGQKVSLLVFKNGHKQDGDRQPYYHIFEGTPREKRTDTPREDDTPF